MAQVGLDVIIRAVDRLTGPVRAISERLNRLTEPARRVASSFRAMSEAAGVHRLTAGFQRVGIAVGRLQAQVRGIAQAFVGLLAAAGGLAFGFNRAFVVPAAQMERFRISLTSIEGSAEAADRALAWVDRFANDVPLSIADVTDAFIRLRVFGLHPMDGTLQALVDQNAKMGGSAEQLRAIILAVGQAWQKGKLQGEEALQLIERGVPVWDLLAKRVGTTTAEVQKAATQGKLTRDAIRALVEEMGKASEGSAQQQMNSWDGMVSRLTKTWQRFRNLIMDSGPFAFLKAQLGGLLARFDAMAASGELKELAERIGGRIVDAFKNLIDVGKNLFAGLKILSTIFGPLVQGVLAVVEALGGFQAIAVVLAGLIAGKLVLAIGALVPAVVSLGAALLATPIGLFAVAIAALVGLAAVVVANWEPISEFFTGLWDGVVRKFEWAWSKIKPIVDAISAAFDFGGIGRSISSLFGGLSPGATAGAQRPLLGAEQIGSGGSLTTRITEARVRMDFGNVPRGARIQIDPSSDAPLDLSTGYAMIDAMP